MSSPFDQFEDQLRAAAHARVTARRGPRARRWLGSGLRAVPVAVALATTVAIVVAALVLLHHSSAPARAPAPGAGGPGLPSLASPRGRRELGYIERATRATQSTAACRTQGAQPPAVVHGTPSAQLRSMLGVLRRPARAGDSPGASLSGTEGVYAGAARRARVTGGISYYLVPVRTYPDAGQPTPRCLDAQQAALRRLAPSLPAGLRAQTEALQGRLIAFDRRLITGPVTDTLCFVLVQRNGGSQSCGITAAQVRGGDPGAGNDNGTVSGIVPDGVATVTLRYAAQGTTSARTLRGSVIGNVYVVAGVRTTTLTSGPTIVWHAVDGRALRTIRPPTERQIRAYCQNRPLQCGISPQVESASSSSASATTASAASAPAGG